MGGGDAEAGPVTIVCLPGGGRVWVFWVAFTLGNRSLPATCIVRIAFWNPPSSLIFNLPRLGQR